MIRVLLLIALAIGDILLTRSLLTVEAGSFYESNPVANWILTRFGWFGMTLFKLLTVVAVLGVVVIIARSRPQVGKRILTFGCAAQFLVVTYSIFLLSSRPDLKEESIEVEKPHQMVVRFEFQKKMVQMRSAVLSHEMDLTTAAAELAKLDRMSDPEWQQWLYQNYPTDSLVLSLRQYLVNFIVDTTLHMPREKLAALNHEVYLVSMQRGQMEMQ